MTKKNKTIFVEEETTKVEAPAVTVDKLSATHNMFELPSKGKFGYDMYAQYRELMVADEEVLSSASPETYAFTLNGVVKDVLGNPTWYGDMTVADRDFSVIWIWANNYGSIKEVNIECAHCKHNEVHKVDLTKLPVIDVKENFKSDFEIPVNKTGKSVKVKLNTVNHELEVEDYLKKYPDADYAHLMAVASIDLGVNLPFEKRLDWVRTYMSSKELGFVKQFHKYFAYGVSPFIEHKCSKCGGVTKGKIPFRVKDILQPTPSQEDFERLL